MSSLYHGHAVSKKKKEEQERMNKEYREMVDRNLENNSSEIFGNFSREHAEYITASFIAKAEKSIEILTGNFDDDLYDNISVETLLEEAARRIKVKSAIRVISLNGKDSLRLKVLIDRLDNDEDEGIHGVVVQKAGMCANPDQVNHYIVVDQMRYRLEEPHELRPARVKAEVCCNGKVRSAQLRGGFNRAWRALEGKCRAQD